MAFLETFPTKAEGIHCALKAFMKENMTPEDYEFVCFLDSHGRKMRDYGAEKERRDALMDSGQYRTLKERAKAKNGI
jgi:hypothetical protein